METGGEEDVDDLVGVPGGVVERTEQFVAIGSQADLLGQLSGCRDLGRLAGDVAETGRDLEQQGIDRRPVLADQRDGAVVVERQDGDRARDGGRRRG